ncbi:hypothetical protein BTJ68_09784 [Hortaea werneckii EXF-2000]|uniref:Uncharacterized protein n=1 Tax=Hortaea werneckii EXF-2000 TaxID=1157616 RepID=A0A1Z5T069_HORWE|nr:hypothetical protein BTJ68_09784 [Hortaea werneckii EXF-2000]
MSPSLPRLALALATSLLPTTTLAAMGPAFSTGPVADPTFIRSANATLLLPAVPRNNAGIASLWVDEYQDDSGNYTQTVSLNGHVVSTLSTSDGHAQGWGSAVECAETNCGTVSAHSWVDVSIVMDSADPDYKLTQAKGEGVTGELTTNDGGKTWTVGKIGIPEHSF